MIEIYCDGLTEPNPGNATWAIIAYKDGEELHRDYGMMIGAHTNNQAEYQAMIEALRWAGGTGELCTIYSDSQLVVKQLNGEWAVKAEGLVPWYRKACDLMGNATIQWIRGNENKADEWTRVAYGEVTGQYPLPRVKGSFKCKFIPYEQKEDR